MTIRQSDVELKPEVSFITSLIKQVTSGKLRVPRFQRSYIWKPDQIIHLFDSIYNMYPIGSLLIWETASPMSSIDKLGPIDIPASVEGTAYGYLLDGQQRMTTLAVVLGGNLHENEDSAFDKWRVYFDLEDKLFLHLKPGQELEANHFPLSSLTNTFRFLQSCQNISENGGSKAKHYIEVAEDLSERMTRLYSLPIVTIKGTTLDEAVKIFSRLNRAGTKISDDQMVSALSYRQGKEGAAVFNLSEIITNITDELESVNFRDINRNLILRAILGEMELDVYRTSWDTLVKDHREELESAAIQSKDNLLWAVDFLKKEGVTCESLLPYTMQLVLLAIYYKYHRKQGRDESLEILRRWFWVTSFSGWFAYGNATTIRRAILDLKRISQGFRSGFESIDLEEPVLALPGNFDFRAGRIRTFCLFLMSLSPRNITNGEPIDKDEVLSHGFKTYPYIFRKTKATKERHNSPENRILLGQNYYPSKLDTNNTLSASVEALDNTEKEMVLSSHGITTDAERALFRDDRVAFLDARRRYLIERELDFMRQKNVIPPNQPTEQLESIPDREDD